MKKRIIYKLMVLALKLARVLAVKYGCAAAILADAEGDSGYYKVRRPARRGPQAELGQAETDGWSEYFSSTGLDW